LLLDFLNLEVCYFGLDRDPDPRAAQNLPKGRVDRHRHRPADRPGADLALGIG